MATTRIIKVRKAAGMPQVELKRILPTRADESDLIDKAFGSMERALDRAAAAFAVDVQNPLRSILVLAADGKGYTPESMGKARKYLAEYTDDGKKSAPIPTIVRAKPGQFDEEQLAVIRASGALVEIIED